MLSISTTAIEGGVPVILDDKKRTEIMARARALNEDGFRVIVIATREIAPDETKRTYRTDDMWHVFDANSIENQSLFQSGWFVEGLLSQTLIVHMIRTEKIPFFQSTAAPPVVLLTTAIMAVGIAIPFSPLGAAVGLQPLPMAYFPWLAGILLAYCVLIQMVKTVYRRRFGLWL